MTCLTLQTNEAVRQTIRAMKKTMISAKEANKMVQIAMIMPTEVVEMNFH